jgi:division protein CdvB (Snf7/Vps24/ESCRT-III family)
MSVIKGIQSGLKTMLPEADQSFGQISELLGGIMSGSSQMTSSSEALKAEASTISLDEEAVDILQEATAIVEESTRGKFPDLQLPTDSEIKSSPGKTQASSIY